MPDLDIQHDAANERFTARVDGHLCEAVYRLHDGVMHLVHTAVPRALQGQGIAARLVDAALAEARARGWRVRPVCSYVASHMRRHPETQDLLER